MKCGLSACLSEMTASVPIISCRITLQQFAIRLPVPGYPPMARCRSPAEISTNCCPACTARLNLDRSSNRNLSAVVLINLLCSSCKANTLRCTPFSQSPSVQVHRTTLFRSHSSRQSRMLHRQLQAKGPHRPDLHNAREGRSLAVGKLGKSALAQLLKVSHFYTYSWC